MEELYDLGRVGELEFGVHVPSIGPVNEYNTLAFIDLRLASGYLGLTAGHLMKLIDIIKGNIDEKSRFTQDSESNFQRIKLDIDLD